MKPFVINQHGRLVFPANFLGELDFSVLGSLDQFTAVIGRDFEAKAPTGTDILARVEAGTYPGRFELLRDLGQNLYWANFLEGRFTGGARVRNQRTTADTRPPGIRLADHKDQRYPDSF